MENSKGAPDLPAPGHGGAPRWFADLPIRRKLYLVVAILSFNILVVISLSVFGLGVFSSVRAFVGGEGLWAKAQKNAVYHLARYATLKDESDFATFRQFLAVPLGDRQARIELAKPDPDLDAVARAFVAGRNQPEDAPGMARLFARFGRVGPIRRAIAIWGEADDGLLELESLGEELHQSIQSGRASPASIAALTVRIDRLNQQLTVLEDRFSFTLGEASRWAFVVLVSVTVGVSLLLGTVSVRIALVISGAIAAGLGEVVVAASRAAEGDLSVRVRTTSRDELGVLAGAFNHMTEGLAKLDQLKNDFLSTVSHELRTPLTLTLAPVESLLASEYGPVPERQRPMLETVHHNAVRLLQMVNGLLDFSRLQSGGVEVTREPTDVAALTRSIMADFAPLAGHRGLCTEAHAPEGASPVLMDRYLYERIVFNLVSNAVKFTEPGGRVDVTLAQDGETLRLVVQDTGVGIAPAAMKDLFLKFRQVDATATRRYEGTGLGLALVREFAGLLGGTVSAESVVGEGSRFTVTIAAPRSAEPVDEARRARSAGRVLPIPGDLAGLQQPGAPAPDPDWPRVLIAEDNVELASYLESLLSGFCQPRIAGDGEEAARVAVDWAPALVIADVMMPRKDGFALCRELKASEATAAIPVVLLTALTHRDAMLRGWEAGADEYLFKPFHPREVVTRVKAILASSRERRRMHEALMDSQARLRALSRRLLQVQEEDRRAIARELHDEIGQALTAVRLNLQAAGQAGLAKGDGPLQDCMAVVDDAVERMRNLCVDLRPALLDDVGLGPALQWHIEQLARRAGIVAAVRVQLRTPRLPPNLEIAAFRVVQEAVTNVVRHAQARTVQVDVEQEGEDIVLRISDDGRGFDVSSAWHRAGEGKCLGLVGMNERAQLLGGSFRVSSGTGAGTEVAARFPVAVEAGVTS